MKITIIFGFVDFVKKTIHQNKCNSAKTTIKQYCKKTVKYRHYIVQRGFLPPILLFIVDLSGSMGETISV